MAIKTDIIDISYDVVTQILTEIISHNAQKITETWIQEQILVSTIKFYNEIPEKLNINYHDFFKHVRAEIESLTEFLEMQTFKEEEIDNVSTAKNINQYFLMQWRKLKTVVDKRKSELVQLEQQRDNSDCPPGWIQVKSSEKISTHKLKFMDMQERIYNRRSGNKISD